MNTHRSSWLVAAAITLAVAGVSYAGSACCSKGGGTKNDSQTTATVQCEAKAKGCDSAQAKAKGGDCKHDDSKTTGPGCGHKH